MSDVARGRPGRDSCAVVLIAMAGAHRTRDSSSKGNSVTTQKKNRAAWAKALRSGDYTQGQCTLRSRDDEFCCLGVACDLAVNAGIIEPPVILFSSPYYHYRGHSGFLPEQVQTWLGLDSSRGGLADGNWPTLTQANDEGVSFAEIADLIESGQVLTTDGAP